MFKYQVDFVCDPSRFKICRKARQIGISEFGLAFESWLDVFSGEPVYLISRTQKQSIYLMDKFYKWGKFFSACGLPIKYDVESRSECKVYGVDVKSLSSNAVGDEGFTGNVKLDEAALFQNDLQIYRSLLPTITTGYKISIVSRPFGMSNLFYSLCSDIESYPNYSRHTCDIYKAIKHGFKIDVESIASAFGGVNDEGFRENYLCEFIDESTAFITYELIRSCIGDRAEQTGELFLGVDVGRKKDLTVCYVGNKLGDKIYTQEIHVLKNQPFAIQESFIVDLVRRLKIRAGGIDSTGLGMALAESVQKKCYQIEPVNFNAQEKEEMAYRTKINFEKRNIQIPNDSDLISDIHGIKKTVTSTNRINFDAERNTQGHSDRFWALALMLKYAEPTNQMEFRQMKDVRNAEKLTKAYI